MHGKSPGSSRKIWETQIKNALVKRPARWGRLACYPPPKGVSVAVGGGVGVFVGVLGGVGDFVFVLVKVGPVVGVFVLVKVGPGV